MQHRHTERGKREDIYKEREREREREGIYKEGKRERGSRYTHVN